MRKIYTLLILLILTGCAAVPKQIVDAMQVQKEELQRVKTIYFNNMNNQLDAIEKYRLAILDIYEEQYRNDIRKAPGTTKDSSGTISEALVAPTGDDEIDVYNIKLLSQIEDFFANERDSVRLDINKRRAEIRKAEQNFENIEQINLTVNQYLESLSRLKESKDKLASSIRKKLWDIGPIPFSLEQLPDPKTIEDVINNFKTKKHGTN
uniref:hypothetical protein n=1 Tax=uncultured Draconibacterium sp. TaxID=1573823 RepID=UPI003216556C